ncbi:MAG TPA: iron chelate uptake ABC transporter family permease subunit [Nocardioides sp.]|uniref:FecCD family ABC transporter permease n=1 Tax=Nocardioides sp. TaxID=35761 RepID=UPI002D7F59DA|nr:iron chelate uptake ABC transporter family permease subunit [Nocardioides sp.]HET6653861.1 iron chelate uptake ABC transporter family permease subunit [Nocardioides sp.]
MTTDLLTPTRDAADRLHAVAVRRRRRGVLVSSGLGLVTLAVVALNLSVGDLPVPLSQVLATLVGRGDETSTLVLVEFRLPRLVLGALVGVGLGLAGGLFQSVLRNPLASPDVIGVTQGASVGAVTGLLVLGLSGAWVAAAALVGAAAVTTVNLALAWRGGVTGYRFVLCGIGLAFVATSALGYLLTRSDVRDAQAALVWLSGSVSSATWEGNARLAVALAVLVPAALAMAPRLRMLALGDDTATALGVRAGRVRVLALVTGTALAAVATAAAGPVAFVALASAPIARRLVGDGRVALGSTAMVGVTVVTASDFVAQHLLPGLEAPVGIVTGLVGGAYLIWLLATTTPGGAR